MTLPPHRVLRGGRERDSPEVTPWGPEGWGLFLESSCRAWMEEPRDLVSALRPCPVVHFRELEASLRKPGCSETGVADFISGVDKQRYSFGGRTTSGPPASRWAGELRSPILLGVSTALALVREMTARSGVAQWLSGNPETKKSLV